MGQQMRQPLLRPPASLMVVAHLKSSSSLLIRTRLLVRLWLILSLLQGLETPLCQGQKMKSV
jgi:hypothetical protein